jgi:hypothetical protein
LGNANGRFPRSRTCFAPLSESHADTNINANSFTQAHAVPEAHANNHTNPNASSFTQAHASPETHTCTNIIPDSYTSAGTVSGA